MVFGVYDLEWTYSDFDSYCRDKLLACVVVIEVEIGDMINRLYIETNWCVRFWPNPVSR